MNADNVLNSCDPITTMEGANRPIVTPLIPVKGLRRDEKGNLTEDSVKTIMEGVKSMGIDANSTQATEAILQEAKSVLCQQNAQFSFLLKAMFSAISRSEEVDKTLVDKLQKKNQEMLDVLSVSRYVLNKPVETNKDGMKEGFLGKQYDPFMNYREAFQTVTTTVQDRDAKLKEGRLLELQTRKVEATEDKNRYASRLLSMYGFLNIVAIGLLMYVVSAT